MKRSLCMTILFVFLSLVSSATALCYYPKGNPSNDIPCEPSADDSFCCGPGWVCLSNGVCRGMNSTHDFIYARGSCTDSSWLSASCPRFCITENVAGGTGMSDCGSGRNWCCAPNDRCCSRGTFSLPQAKAETSVKLALSYPSSQSTASHASKAEITVRSSLSYPSGQSTTPQASNSSAKVITSSSTTNIPATQVQHTAVTTSIARTTPAAAAEPAHKNSSSDIGLKVGVGMGIPVGIALFGILVYIIYLHWKAFQNKSNHPAGSTSTEEEMGPLSPQLFRALEVGYPPTELPGIRERVELLGRGASQLRNHRVQRR